MQDKPPATPPLNFEDQWWYRLLKTMAIYLGVFLVFGAGLALWILADHKRLTQAELLSLMSTLWSQLIQGLVTLLSPLNDLGLFRDGRMTKDPPIMIVVYAILATIGLMILLPTLSCIFSGKQKSLEERETELSAEQEEEERRAAAEPDAEALEDDDMTTDTDDQDVDPDETTDSEDREA